MSTLDGSPKTLEQLFAELKDAGDALGAARQEEGTARNRAVDALNVYNGITKKIDAALRKLREASPPGTEWGNVERGGTP